MALQVAESSASEIDSEAAPVRFPAPLGNGGSEDAEQIRGGTMLTESEIRITNTCLQHRLGRGIRSFIVKDLSQILKSEVSQITC